ncbi:single-stranded DNA-binding protein [Corynebacterium liangguodongii]|uniref:Uncharacterized protein n=1 Tax=Corynebacterium liangguodongii TaxID=2079535 RepID=A0A2S0WFJ8_9CORY|nr:single-stranded DNA-binding protein [Corynebacterium liangguodongii]AWB84555.1 hypothetical protein C3E79_08705 [Corynebacterium liangguodongii]PWB98861.1 single-stranded DNA-binding protein [Corynebacterium liangguodongii]
MSQMHVTVNGNLTHDPELLHFGDQKFLAKFRVASSRSYRTNEKGNNDKPIWQEVDNLFIDVECWGQLAVNSMASLFKGAPVIATGYLVSDMWEDASRLNDKGEPVTRQKIVLKAYRVAFELGNYQVSSKKVSHQGNTPEGMSPVTVVSGEELVAQSAAERVSAEDKVSLEGNSFDDAVAEGVAHAELAGEVIAPF